mmetsp:Transcript_30506/g.41769  ORF Transcript_30506/g.41769 Transcript_30506/m.41769 type:complete len:716 (+) Transcript_30506:1-2148(+)
MKMAEAFKAKKLKPGASIPGCNSFFLCKYLKDTMLQARTYLFCAIRPEVQFLKYTFATLGFAQNASVVKLAPKKATVAASAQERKLMAELEAMKALVAQLQANNSNQPSNTSGSVSEDAERMIAELQAKLAEKQNDLTKELSNEGSNEAVEQRAEYAKRGISLVAYEPDNKRPYFSNLDDDAFRSNRFMYILRKEITVFGHKGDIQLMSLSVLKDHCKVRLDEDGKAAFIIGGKGDTWRNGHRVAEDAEEKVEVFDRIAVGDQLMLFRWPDNEEGLGEPMTAEDAVAEYQAGLINNRGGGGANSKAAADELNDERKRILEEREKWEQEKNQMQSQRNELEYQRAMASVDNAILDLLPKAKEAKQTVDLLNRVSITFDVVLEKGADQIPKVKISVENSHPKLSILIDPQEFLPKLSLLKDEMMKLRSAIDANREYEIPERHDPLYLMFDNDFHLGTATHWPEYLLYNLETDEEERMQDVKNAAVPYNNVGLLEVRWIPLAGPDEEDAGKPILDIEQEEDLLGRPWTYRLEIKRACDLPVFCEMAYVSYEFFGDVYTTEAVQQTTFSPVFDYSKIHHVPSVTPEFIKYLKGSVEMQIHVNQHVEGPTDKIGTANAVVVESIRTGEPKGYDYAEAKRPKSEAEVRCEQLTVALALATEENTKLANRIKELELMLAQVSSQPKSRQLLSSALMIDSIVNGAGEPGEPGIPEVKADFSAE